MSRPTVIAITVILLLVVGAIWFWFGASGADDAERAAPAPARVSPPAVGQ